MSKWNTLNKKWSDIMISENFKINKKCNIDCALKDSGITITKTQLRNKLIKYINSIDQNEFDQIIENYKLEFEHGEFIGDWDPNEVKTKRHFNKIIKNPLFNFPGDYTTMTLLSNILELNFILLLDTSINTSLILEITNQYDKYILIYYDGSSKCCEYRSVGLVENKKINTIFSKDSLPIEFQILLNNNQYLLKQIEKLNCKKLNNIIKTLEETIYRKLQPSERNFIFKKVFKSINCT